MVLGAILKSTNPRDLALELLNRVDRNRSYLNLLLPKFQERLSPRDRGFLQELTYGAIRWRLQYDLLIDSYVNHRDLEVEVRNILRLGAHQIFRMRVGSHAAANESVELAKTVQPKTTGLVNAVMRKFATANLEQLVDSLTSSMTEIERLAYKYSVPGWIIGQFASALKVPLSHERLLRELESLNETPRVNLSVVDPTIRERLTSLGATPGLVSPLALEVSGDLSPFLTTTGARVQDEGSQLIAQLVATKSGDGAILDLCAGPGGKAALIADLRPANPLICVEPVPARAELVRRALGKNRADIEVADGTTFDPGQRVTAVLVDAPCSGLGSLRRKPESRWLKSETDIPGLRILQVSLLENAARILTPGGHLVYSTCSPVLAETTSVIAEFLENNQDFKLCDAGAELQRISPGLNLPTGRKTVQLWTGVHGTDDMFIALMRKDG